MYQKMCRFGVLLLAAATALGTTAQANAAYTTASWLASPTNGSFTTAANWSGGIVPNSYSYIASFGSSTVTSINMAATNISLYQLTFDASASNYTFYTTNNSGLFNFTSNAGSGIIVNAGTQTLAFNIRSYGSFAVTNNSTGLLSLTSEFGANVNGAITGTVTGSGNVQVAYLTRRYCQSTNQFNVVKNGTGTLTIAGTCSAGSATALGCSTGTTAILGGAVAISSEGCLGGNPGGYWSGTTWVDGSFNASALTIDGGALEATSSFTIDDSNRGITIGSSNGTLNVDSGKTIVQAGLLKLSSAAQNAVFNLGGANVQGGTLSFDYTGGTSPAATVKSLLTSAYANSFASGQIYNSSATANIGLGWADDTTNSHVIVMSAYYGDATLDGSVDGSDLIKLLTNYGQGSMAWSQGDFTYDDKVDGSDLIKMLTN